MTYEKELRLSCNELKWVVWACQYCGAEQSLDLSDKKQVEELYNERKGEVKFCNCGIGRQPSDAALFYALQNLKDFLRKAGETNNKISFRIAIEREVNEKAQEPKN